jgi:hypothetical protein
LGAKEFGSTSSGVAAKSVASDREPFLLCCASRSARLVQSRATNSNRMRAPAVALSNLFLEIVLARYPMLACMVIGIDVFPAISVLRFRGATLIGLSGLCSLTVNGLSSNIACSAGRHLARPRIHQIAAAGQDSEKVANMR